MIRKYKMKNSHVEAIQYDGSNYEEIATFTKGFARKPYDVERGVTVFDLSTQFGSVHVYPGMYVVHFNSGPLTYNALQEKEFHERYERV